MKAIKRSIIFILAAGYIFAAVYGLKLFGNDRSVSAENSGESRIQSSDTSDQEVSVVEKKRLIALTFDDGPKAGTTDVLLDGLKERNVHATFFLIGMQIEDNIDIIRQMADDGHQIGNHTFGHKNLSELSSDEQKKQLVLCREEIEKTAMRDTVCVRPPYGAVNDRIKSWISAPIILWSVDTRDWTGKKAGEIADYIVKVVKPGDIILMHDIYAESVKGALMAVDTLKAQGYEFVTVEELFEAENVSLENGKVYRKAY